MWSGFCGELIRKTNQRLLIVVMALAAGLVLFFGYNRAYFRGFFGGPATPALSMLLSASSASAFSNAIIRVESEGAEATGLFERTKDDSHPEGYVSARYVATNVGSKRLLVRVGPNDPRAFDTGNPAVPATNPATTLAGHVKPLSSSLSEGLNQATSPGEATYLPYVLDTYDYKAFGWVSSFVGGALLLLALWGARTYLQRSSNPVKDPFARGIAKYGPLETTLPQVDADMASAHTTVKRGANAVHIAQHWLAVATPFRAYGTRLDGLVWVYRLVVKKRVYFFIPAGTRHTLMLYDRFGQKIAVQMNEAKTTEAIQLLRNTAPQAVYGYDKRLVSLWKAGSRASDRAGFITEAQTLLSGQVVPEAVTRNMYTAG